MKNERPPREAHMITRPVAIAREPSDELPALVEQVAETTRAQALELPSGRVVEARPEPAGEDRITIRGRSGEVELEVRMTEHGPVLRFRAADVELASTGEVRVDCERFHVRAEKEIFEETGGHLRQRVAGNASVWVRGQHSTKAGEARVEAKRGSVQIEANDDVQLLGERIKMNC